MKNVSIVSVALCALACVVFSPLSARADNPVEGGVTPGYRACVERLKQETGCQGDGGPACVTMAARAIRECAGR